MGEGVRRFRGLPCHLSVRSAEQIVPGTHRKLPRHRPSCGLERRLVVGGEVNCTAALFPFSAIKNSSAKHDRALIVFLRILAYSTICSPAAMAQGPVARQVNVSTASGERNMSRKPTKASRPLTCGTERSLPQPGMYLLGALTRNAPP